jgi:hypothetical protein
VSPYGCIDSTQSTINIFQPIVDIGIVNNGINKSGSKWLMKALFKNNGNLTINELDVKLNLQGKSVLYEHISSLNLLPGNSIEYEFKSSFDASDYYPSYFCIDVTAVDNSADYNSQNNSYCSTLKKDFECYNLYPNPATDYVSFGITIPEDDNIDITLYDENGKSMKTPARISRSYGIIEVSKKKFEGYTVPVRMAILLHEFSHYYLNTDMANETEADLNGLLIYLGLGYPRVDAYNVFTQVFVTSPTEINKDRMKIIDDFIKNFEEKYVEMNYDGNSLYKNYI